MTRLVGRARRGSIRSAWKARLIRRGFVTAALCWSALLADAPDETLDALLTRAREAYRAGSFDEAVSMADRAVQAAASDTAVASARLTRAVIYEAAGRWNDALGDYARAIETFPERGEIRNRRGALYFKLGLIDESIADFDKAVALDPSLAPHHWQRGISYYYAGRLTDCIKQFERHRAVNPDDVENAFWHFMCKAGQDGLEAAREALLPVGLDGRPPMMTIYSLLRQEAGVQDVLGAARRADGATARRDAALFYAHFYAGLYYEIIGNHQAAAFHVSKAAREIRFEHYMGDVARIHAERLRAGP